MSANGIERDTYIPQAHATNEPELTKKDREEFKLKWSKEIRLWVITIASLFGGIVTIIKVHFGEILSVMLTLIGK